MTIERGYRLGSRQSNAAAVGPDENDTRLLTRREDRDPGVSDEGGAGISGAAVGNAVWAGGNLTFTPGGPPPPSGAPEATAIWPGAPSILADFDYGAEADGAITSIVPVAGTETAARTVVGGGAPAIVTMANGRKALAFNGTTDWAGISNFVTWINAANDVPFTMVSVVWADVAASQGIAGVTKGINSGASTVNRYDLFLTATSTLGRKADGASQSDAAPTGTVSLAAPNIFVWSINGNPGATQTRMMRDGGTKASSPARSITNTLPFSGNWTVGARMINPDGTTRSTFLTGRIERQLFFAGAMTDADMDAAQTALAAYYTV